MIGDAAFLVVELTLLFIGVAFIVQITQRRMGAERVRRWMGGRPVVAALKGIAIGFITPFCTYSAIPLLVGLRRAGVPPAGYVAFIVAAPVLDPVLFGALALIVGLDAAILYAAVAFTAAMTLALVAQATDFDRHLKPMPASLLPAGASTVAAATAVPADGATAGASCDTSIDTEMPWRGWRPECRDAWSAAKRLLRSMGPLLLVGVAIGLAIEALVSPETAARITGDNSAFSIPVAAALGTPLYFSTELFVPIADSLRSAGVGVGAIVALTIAGAGANVPEFVVLSRLARARVIAVFCGYVLTVAIVGGLLAAAIT